MFRIQSKIKTYIENLKLKQLQEILEPGPPLLFIACISYITAWNINGHFCTYSFYFQ